MLSAHVSRLLSCKRMFLPISVICWAWENLISHHHWGWSLTDIDALRVDAPRVIILRLAQPSFSVLSPITFMLILLAVILNCDRDRYTAFNQQQNTGALLASDGCIIFSLCWWHFSTVGGGGSILLSLEYFLLIFIWVFIFKSSVKHPPGAKSQPCYSCLSHFCYLTIPSLPPCALMNVNNTVQRVKRDPADQAAWDQG